MQGIQPFVQFIPEPGGVFNKKVTIEGNGYAFFRFGIEALLQLRLRHAIVQYWHTIEFDPAWCGKPMNNRLDACRANQIGAKIRKIRN